MADYFLKALNEEIYWDFKLVRLEAFAPYFGERLRCNEEVSAEVKTRKNLSDFNVHLILDDSASIRNLCHCERFYTTSIDHILGYQLIFLRALSTRKFQLR